MSSDLIRYNNVDYVMPFLYAQDIWMPILKELLKESENPIKCVYGSVKSKWSGGRRSRIKLNSPEAIRKYFKKITNRYNYEPSITFTNKSITKEDLKDKFCNEFLDAAYEYNASFIVCSDLLYDHIKKRYKEAKMVCSVINPITRFLESGFNETEYYNEMLDKFDIIVLRPEYTIKNADKLDKLIKDLPRCEILINQTCHWNCPEAKRHYSILEAYESNKIIPFNAGIKDFCPTYKEGYNPVRLKHETIQKCIDQGIKLLKIQGRHFAYFDDVYNELYNYFFNNEINKEELRKKIDLISTQLIQSNKTAALFL